MARKNLISKQEYEQLIRASKKTPAIIFKHSTRCSISAVVLDRLNEASKKFDIHIIDVINNRDISNMIAQDLHVVHRSPQLLVVQNGVCSFHASHMEISSDMLSRHLMSY